MGEVLVNVALDRMKQLVDEGSFVELQSDVVARNTDFAMNDHKESSDGVVTGYGLVDGRLVFLYSQNPDVLNGSMGEMHCKKIMEIYLQAVKVGAPVIGLLDCSGFRLQEATDALDGFGDVLMALQDASGSVPLFTVIYGNCGGGLSLIPAISDFNFMVKNQGRMYVNSPNTLEENYKEKLDTASGDYQSAYTGVVDEILAPEEIRERIAALLQLLPSNNTEGCMMSESADDLNRFIEGMDETNFDIDVFVRTLADEYFFVETKKDFATDMLTGFIRLNGITVGVYGNRGEGMSTMGMDKAASFIRFCDGYDIPLLSIADATRFDTTVQAEKTLARSMAAMSAAIIDADVPKVCLIPRQAYGTPYLLMNSKSIGSDFVYAWPNAKIGAMKAESATKILKDVSKAEYEESHNSAAAQARRGYVHKLIAPQDTRKYLLSAFDLLYTKNKTVAVKKNSLR